MSEGVYRTKTGRVLTDADIQALADEAERGYNIDRLIERRTERMICECGKPLLDPFARAGDLCDDCIEIDLALSTAQAERREDDRRDAKLRERPRDVA